MKPPGFPIIGDSAFDINSRVSGVNILLVKKINETKEIKDCDEMATICNIKQGISRGEQKYA